MFVGDSVEWFTDIQIQNGLKYEFQRGDVMVGKPLGVGVMTNSGALLYCRVLQ